MALVTNPSPLTNAASTSRRLSSKRRRRHLGAVPDSEMARARAVLDINRPVDVHDRAVTLGVAPAAHVEAIQEKSRRFRLSPRRR
jgi:hypothetical protein